MGLSFDLAHLWLHCDFLHRASLGFHSVQQASQTPSISCKSMTHHLYEFVCGCWAKMTHHCFVCGCWAKMKWCQCGEAAYGNKDCQLPGWPAHKRNFSSHQTKIILQKTVLVDDVLPIIMTFSQELRDAIPHFTPPANRTEGDDIKLLFHFFLDEVLHRGHLQRMHYRPHTTRNTEKLHSAWWIPFTKGISWCNMTCAEKRKHVRQWLFMKLSNDPDLQVMSPGPRANRVKNQMKWVGFDITDAELDVIVNSMFSQYEAQQWIYFLIFLL